MDHEPTGRADTADVTGPTRVVLFTDLDGSLLDLETGSTERTRRAVHALQAQGVPIVYR